MAINPKSLENIKPHQFKAKWQNMPTTIIRVPTILKDEILDHAHKIDEGKSIVTTDIGLLNDLKKLLTKIDHKQSGYKSNSGSKLISELRAIINRYN